MLGLQAFNTHGTEITPGSDIVAENLDMERGHVCTCLLLSAIYKAQSMKCNHYCKLAQVCERFILAGLTGLSIQAEDVLI